MLFRSVPLDTAAPYAAEDADITFRLHEVLHRRLARVPALLTLYETLEQPVAEVLARMERTGVLVDPQFLRGLGICLRARSPIPWHRYLAWMRLARAPHDDAGRWARDFLQ